MIVCENSQCVEMIGSPLWHIRDSVSAHVPLNRVQFCCFVSQRRCCNLLWLLLNKNFVLFSLFFFLIIYPPLNLFSPRLLIFSAPPKFLSFLRTVYHKCHNTADWEKCLSSHLIGWGSFPVCGSADGSSLCQDEIRELGHAYATGLHIWSFL